MRNINLNSTQYVCHAEIFAFKISILNSNLNYEFFMRFACTLSKFWIQHMREHPYLDRLLFNSKRRILDDIKIFNC